MVIMTKNPVVLVFFVLHVFFFFPIQQVQTDLIESKIFEIEGQQVEVTHIVDQVFYGRYQGGKEGYLLLKEDGTGEYAYDIHIPAKNCSSEIIRFEWGFIVDENNQIVRFERDYGFSYPVIYKCSGDNCFQGCKKTFLVDYILDKRSETLEVSSSDDWVKLKN